MRHPLSEAYTRFLVDTVPTSSDAGAEGGEYRRKGAGDVVARLRASWWGQVDCDFPWRGACGVVEEVCRASVQIVAFAVRKQQWQHRMVHLAAPLRGVAWQDEWHLPKWWRCFIGREGRADVSNTTLIVVKAPHCMELHIGSGATGRAKEVRLSSGRGGDGPESNRDARRPRVSHQRAGDPRGEVANLVNAPYRDKVGNSLCEERRTKVDGVVAHSGRISPRELVVTRRVCSQPQLAAHTGGLPWCRVGTLPRGEDLVDVLSVRDLWARWAAIERNHRARRRDRVNANHADLFR